MAIAAKVRYCEWCRKELPPAKSPGRPKKYCNEKCRSKAYMYKVNVKENKGLSQCFGCGRDYLTLAIGERCPCA